jgi:hypothetical protein
MIQEPTAWIAALKEGDSVILQSGRHSESQERVVPVKRVTATQIVIASPWQRDWDLRFRKADGDEVGARDSWSPRARITEATPERLAAVREAMRRRKLIAQIQQTRWADEPTGVLEAVAAALSETAVPARA